ncbi:hypothetical protein B6I21_07860 [candidate division KSB1 bacterium 4572_119]|nr:MAG: hypothetical protein B6I21_07860 [candidate division KSB1 bacterium 4572_119]
MKRCSITFIFFIIAINPFTQCVAQEDIIVEDNLSVFKRLAANISEAVIEKIAPDTSQTMIINPGTPGEEGNWIIENAFLRGLLNKKLKARLRSKIETNQHILVEFSIDKINVNYSKTTEKGFIGRSLVLDVLVRVQSGLTKDVLLLKTYHQEHTDKIKISKLSEIQNKSYPFTQSPLPERRGIKKYIEAIAALTTTAAIVFSFFILRSK